MKFIFCDLDTGVVSAYQSLLPKFIEVRHGNLLEQKDYDAIVSPANSFGGMGGGIDYHIKKRWPGIEKAVTENIKTNHYGELLLGTAAITPLPDSKHFLISSPTMRLPGDLSESINAYLAMRGILTCVADWNKTHADNKIERILIPGLCTGVGAMPPRRSAFQIKCAMSAFVGKGPIYDIYTGINGLELEMKMCWRAMSTFQ